MIAYLSGKLLEKEDLAVIVDVSGVGYRVAVLSSLKDKLVKGDEVVLQIHHQVSSDNEALYGFGSKQDLKYFQLLLTVPSVGPRTAMGILEAATPQILAQAVSANDTKVLTNVSGVGKKTAERILIELKGKVEMADASTPVGDMQHQAMEALVSIGFSKQQARDAVQNLSAEVGTVEEAVRAVLQDQKV